MATIIKIDKTINNREYILYGVDAEIWETVRSSGYLNPIIAEDELEEHVFKCFGVGHHTNKLSALSLIKKLLFSTMGFDCSSISKLLSDYEEKGMFYEKYRAHLAHQLRVYFIGIALIVSNETIHKKLLDCYTTDEDIIRIWTITALVHDWGYVFEWGNPTLLEHDKETLLTLNSYLSDPICTFFPAEADGFLPKEKEDILKSKSINVGTITSLQNIIDWKGVEEAFQKVEEYADKTNLAQTPGKSLASYYAFMKQYVLYNRDYTYCDHGITSAYILLWLAVINKYYSEELASIIYKEASAEQEHISKAQDTLRLAIAAASAIALHNIRRHTKAIQDKAYDERKLTLHKFKVEFAQTPLAYLLIFADSLQEWERPSYLAENDRDFQAQDMHLLINQSDVFLCFPSDVLAMKNTGGSRFEKITKELESLLMGLPNALNLQETSLADFVGKLKDLDLTQLLPKGATPKAGTDGVTPAYERYKIGRRYANEGNFELAIRYQLEAAEIFKSTGQVTWQSRALGRVAFSSLYHGVPEDQVKRDLEQACALDKWQGTGNYYWIIDHCLKSNTSKETKCHFFSSLLKKLEELDCINLKWYYATNDENLRYNYLRSALVLFFDRLIKRERDARWPQWAMSDQPRLYLLRAEKEASDDFFSSIKYLEDAEASFNEMELTSYGAWTKCKKSLLSIKPYAFSNSITHEDVVEVIGVLRDILTEGRKILQSPRKERDVITFFLSVIGVFHNLLCYANTVDISLEERDALIETCDSLIKGIESSKVDETRDYYTMCTELKKDTISIPERNRVIRKLLKLLDSSKKLAWIETNKIKELVKVHMLEV